MAIINFIPTLILCMILDNNNSKIILYSKERFILNENFNKHVVFPFPLIIYKNRRFSLHTYHERRRQANRHLNLKWKYGIIYFKNGLWMSRGVFLSSWKCVHLKSFGNFHSYTASRSSSLAHSLAPFLCHIANEVNQFIYGITN